MNSSSRIVLFGTSMAEAAEVPTEHFPTIQLLQLQGLSSSHSRAIESAWVLLVSELAILVVQPTE